MRTRTARWRARIAAPVVLALATGALALAGPAVADPEPPPPSSSGPHGLRGEYFAMSAPGAWDFAELGGTRLESRVEFADLNPTFAELVGRTTHTTARWTGQLEAPADDDYTFHVVGDNGFRLWVGGDLVVDHWEADWDNEQVSAPVALTAGPHDFRMELLQEDGGSNLFLRWSSSTIERSIVPDEAFRVPADFVVAHVTAAVTETGDAILLTADAAVAGIDDLADHLTVSVGGVGWPVADVRVDPDRPRTVIAAVAQPVTAGSSVRIAYDGEGGLTAGGIPVVAFDVPASNASEYRMLSRFASDLDRDDPLPEYPRPQLERPQWLNLNGPWQFEATSTPRFGDDLDETVVVPFPVESVLSEIGRHEDHMLYRRTVEVPAGWDIGAGNRLLLQLGAVDHESWVYVNGTEVAHHVGGYDAFTVDITDALDGDGPQEIVIRATDTTDRSNPVGKQVPDPGGIFYTPHSGIWQTVWLEPVPDTAVTQVDALPAATRDAVSVTVRSSGAGTATVTVLDPEGDEVATGSGPAGAPIDIAVPDATLWEPGNPALYGLRVTLGADVVESYFGMRTIEVGEVDGTNHILLNGEKTFLLSTLDQGYWPDGISTAPTDEALRFDLEEHVAMGFNTVRKHIKVEPARWYHHADTLGLLVWQDMPSAWPRADLAKRQAFVDALSTMVDQLGSVPSIIGWVPFNEGWGEWDLAATGEIAEAVKQQDPSRLVNAHSGQNCCDSLGDAGKGDLIDWHAYPGPGLALPDATRAAMDGEHGGYSLALPGHMWPGGNLNPYQNVESSEALTAAYVRNTAELARPAHASLSGSVYTQITDVENELNGLWTYDRALPKLDRDAVREINETIIGLGSRSSATEYATGTPGLDGIAHWLFDEGEGGSARDSVGDRDATGHGIGWIEGRDGAAAVHLDGTGWVDGTSDVLDTTGSYAVSAWVSLDRLPDAYATVVAHDGATGSSAFFLQWGRPVDGFAFSFADGPRAVADLPTETGRWYHLVAVRDAGTQEIRLYVDGELAATEAALGADIASGPLTIGRATWEGAAVDLWPGGLADVRVFDRAVDAAEVAAIFAGEPGTVDPGPVDPDPGPVGPGPVDPGPVDPGPVDPGPVEPGPGTGTTPEPGTPGPGVSSGAGGGGAGAGPAVTAGPGTASGLAVTGAALVWLVGTAVVLIGAGVALRHARRGTA